MSTTTVFEKIKHAIDTAPHNGYVAEIHLQVIKYADILQEVSEKEFCAELNIGEAYGVEFNKMKKIASRLKAAGLNPEKI